MKKVIAMMVMVLMLISNAALAAENDSGHAWNVVADYISENGYDERYTEGFIEFDAYFCIGTINRAEIQKEIGFYEPFECWLMDGGYESVLKIEYNDVQVIANFIKNIDGIDIYESDLKRK